MKPRFLGTSALVKIFSAFAVNAICVNWQELDGILKETGRSIEGNWTTLDGNLLVYWLDWTDYWRKLHVLLKETVRSIYGNWMVWIRKLVGLLTETGWAIDWNWTVYSWKEWSIDGSSPLDFLYFGGLKMRSWEFRNPRFRGHLAFFNSFLSILEARKFDFCRVV